MTYREIIESLITVLIIGLGGFGFGWFRILKETNNLLREQNEELKAENKAWQDKHNDNAQRIASLEGQVKTLKDVPLDGINKSLKTLISVVEKLAKDHDVIIKALNRE